MYIHEIRERDVHNNNNESHSPTHPPQTPTNPQQPPPTYHPQPQIQLYMNVTREKRLTIHTPTDNNTAPPPLTLKTVSNKCLEVVIKSVHKSTLKHQYKPATYNNMNALLAARTKVSNSRHGRESTVSSKT